MPKFLFVVTFLSFASQVSATEWHNYGARAMGMGGAAVALPNGAESAYWNPAGLGAPDNKSGLQLPVGLHFGVTGDVLKAANDLDKIENDCREGGAGFGTCSQANIDRALGDLNETGSGVRGDVGGGAALKIGRAAIFAQNFSYVGARPQVSLNAVDPTTIQNNGSELVARGISMTELGAGYGRELGFAPGLFVGGAAKLIFGNTAFERIRVVNDDFEFDFGSGNTRRSVQPGFDLGAYWDASRSFENVPLRPRLGLTARNVNNPKFKYASAAGAPAKYSVQGAVRMGAAVSPLPFWNIAVDADLTRNHTALEGLASQNVGIGTEINVFNRSWINIPLRAGITKNMAHPGKAAASLGVGLNFLHFNMDAGVTSSPRTQQIQSQGETKKYPNELQGGVQLAFLFGGDQKLEGTKGNFDTTNKQ